MAKKASGAVVPEKHGRTDDEVEPDESLVEPLQTQLVELMADEGLDADEVRPVCQDEGFIRRCLIAAANDAKRAFKIGVSAIRWRSQVKPSQINLADFPTALSQNVWRVGCFAAKDGGKSTVAFAVSKQWNPWKYGTDEYVRLMAYVMETCERAMTDPQCPHAKIYLVHDFRDMSILNGDLRKIRQLAKITSEYYPNRCVGVALNADFVTLALWKLLSPLLDRGTRDRVSIFRPGAAAADAYLAEHIGADQIPPSLGGGTGTRAEEYPLLSEDSVRDFCGRRNGSSRSSDDRGANNTAPLKRHPTDGTAVEAEEETMLATSE